MADTIIGKSGVYEIVNLANGKKYIGSSSNLKKRLDWHRRSLDRGIHRNRHLMSAWRKYGESNFRTSVLLGCLPEHLILYEQIAIDALKPEYNLAPIAGSCRGVKMPPRTAEQRLKYRIASLGHSYNAGIPKSTEHKRKISIALTGRPGNARGRVLSAETKARISASRIGKGKPQSPTHRENRAVAIGGFTRKQVEEIRALHESGVKNQSKIARLYDAHPSSINRLLSGKTYASSQ